MRRRHTLVPCESYFLAECGLNSVRAQQHGTAGFQQGCFERLGKTGSVALLKRAEDYDVRKTRGQGHLIGETAENFATQVMDYARQFTTPGKAARAVGRIKRAVQTGAEIPFESALALERELQQQLFQSEDAKEGLDAYVNKRKAAFKGK